MTHVAEMLERRAIVSGLGVSEMGRRTGKEAFDLTLESVFAALADAGLDRTELDGLASVGRETAVQTVQDVLRLDLSWFMSGVENGGLIGPVMEGCLAIGAGLARHVLVYRTVVGARMGSGSAERRMAATLDRSDGRVAGDLRWSVPYNIFGALPHHALMTRRHMHLYGTTREQLGAVAVVERFHAGFNERAAYRDPITLDDYLEARMVCEPLALLDCDVPIDGSIAIVLSHADFAPDCANPPVRVHAMGGGLKDRGSIYQVVRSDYPAQNMVDAAAQLWTRSDLGPSDVDVAEVYDGFTLHVLLWFEALGFCERGEGGPFVGDGKRLRLGGALPTNTYGGQLSAGRMHGYGLFHEACLQLRGQAGARQVPDVEVAIAAAGAGHAAGCMLLTR
jgi:acetyl-CoA acetyltransferase